MSCPEGQQFNENGKCVDGSIGEKIYYDEYGFPIRVFGSNGATSSIMERKDKNSHMKLNIFKWILKWIAGHMLLFALGLSIFAGYLAYYEFEGDNKFILWMKVIGCAIFWIFYLIYRTLRVVMSK
jgi:hypothetical protein